MINAEELKQDAQNFIYKLAAGDFNGAFHLFDSNMARAIPEARLKETWNQLQAQVGAFQGIGSCQAVERGEYISVLVNCQFEKLSIDASVTYNASKEIAGLVFQPSTASSPYNPPAYIQMTAFHDTDVTVGSGEWALPGTLSLPEGKGPFPAVVLVHGSGPQDRDETIGPNKPFRDLAWGLATNGIAVLRYDKRTKAHAGMFTPELIARGTVQEEVIDDALAAIQLLQQAPGINPKRIYVLGHSLGATLAPRIGQQAPTIARLIIMAGMTRPMEDAILDQFTYLYSLSGEMSEEHKAELEQLKEKVARAKNPNLSDQTPAKDLPLNISPAYWHSIRGYQPAEVAQKLGKRIFVLQGGRDYQVTVKGDFPAWQKALKGKTKATLKIYPGLFHLFIEGEGPSRPEEYLKEGHVSQEVIEDIASWIEKE